MGLDWVAFTALYSQHPPSSLSRTEKTLDGNNSDGSWIIVIFIIALHTLMLTLPATGEVKVKVKCPP